MFSFIHDERLWPSSGVLNDDYPQCDSVLKTPQPFNPHSPFFNLMQIQSPFKTMHNFVMEKSKRLYR